MVLMIDRLVIYLWLYVLCLKHDHEFAFLNSIYQRILQFSLRLFFDLRIDFSLVFVAELTLEGRLRWILLGVVFLELINNRLL